jgi:hypothetical protein
MSNLDYDETGPLGDLYVTPAPEPIEILNAGPSPESIEMEADALRHIESAKILEGNVHFSVGPTQVGPMIDVLDQPALATQDEFEQLKSDINASFEELSNVLLDIQRGFTILMERIDRYNERSSHKI